MSVTNLGVCMSCRERVPATHVKREGKVYIRKECPNCGPSEALVSSDAGAWQRKRDLWGRRDGGADVQPAVRNLP